MFIAQPLQAGKTYVSASRKTAADRGMMIITGSTRSSFCLVSAHLAARHNCCILRSCRMGNYIAPRCSEQGECEKGTVLIRFFPPWLVQRTFAVIRRLRDLY